MELIKRNCLWFRDISGAKEACRCHTRASNWDTLNSSEDFPVDMLHSVLVTVHISRPYSTICRERAVYSLYDVMGWRLPNLVPITLSAKNDLCLSVQCGRR